MSEYDRIQLNLILELSASQAGCEDVRNAAEFIGLLRHPTLLSQVNLSPDILGLVTGYINANLAGGEELEQFISRTFAKIPESVFDTPLSPETGIDLGDVIAMARFALGKWSFGRPPKNGNGSGK